MILLHTRLLVVSESKSTGCISHLLEDVSLSSFCVSCLGPCLEQLILPLDPTGSLFLLLNCLSIFVFCISFLFCLQFNLI